MSAFLQSMWAGILEFSTRNITIGPKDFPLWQVATASIVALYAGYKMYRSMTRPKYNYYTTATQIMAGQDLSDRVIIVTGGNTGLGKETIRHLIRAGATVVMASRSKTRAETAMNDIKTSDPKFADNLSFIPLDLGSFDSIYAFSQTFNNNFDRLDILINNAGVSPSNYWETELGFESGMGINHFGHSYLTLLLTPALKKSQYGHVVFLSSGGIQNSPMKINDMPNQLFTTKKGDFVTKDTWDNYETFGVYDVGKSCNVVFAYQYNKEHYKKNNKESVSCVSCVPGFVVTDLGRDFSSAIKMFAKIMAVFAAKSMEQGIATTLRAATLNKKEIELYNGEFFGDSNPWSINKNIYHGYNMKQLGPFLPPDHDPQINENFDNVAKQLYDWTVKVIKQHGGKL